MADNTINSALSTFIRAQSASVTAGLAAMKSNQKAQQAIVSQIQENFDSSKASTNQVATASANASLPRGSLVNIVV